jgi:hypothetical protein
MLEWTAEVTSADPSDRLLTGAQIARVRTVRAAVRRRERAPAAAAAAPIHVSVRDPAPRPELAGPHPWGDLLDAVFRPGTKQHRAADRLLTLRQSGREELAAWACLSGASVSNLVNILGRAGFDIQRWAGHDRRVQFRVLGHEPCGPEGPSDVEEPLPDPDATKVAGTDPRLLLLAERIGARVRYLGDDNGIVSVEVDGQETVCGRLLGPVLPVSVITGAATLQRITLDRGAIDLEMGDRTHRVRLRLYLRAAPRASAAGQ